jgi:hypothetical protein
MYANQVCSRIGRAFCKRVRLNPLENYFNGVYCASGGEETGLRVYSRIRQIDFFRWTPQLNSSIVIVVRAPLSGGYVETKCLCPAVFAALQIC